MQSLILTEGLAGLQAQALGLAERAGLTPNLQVLHPTGLFARLPPRFWPDPLRTTGVGADLPPLVIGCGGKAAAVLARLHGTVPHVVQVQHPRLDPRRFDLVVAARHDQLTGPNVVVTRTALHRVTPSRLAAEAELWAPRFAHLQRPVAAVLVGGSNGRYRLEQAEGTALAAQLATMMRADGLTVAVTPSRRTAPSVTNALRQAILPLGGYVWDGTGDNPYFGLLALADLIIVTQDSVSMVSEAVATAAPVLVARLPGRSARIARFLQGLVAERRIRFYAGRAEAWHTAPLDDTGMAADRLRALIGR